MFLNIRQSTHIYHFAMDPEERDDEVNDYVGLEKKVAAVSIALSINASTRFSSFFLAKSKSLFLLNSR
jgi:hypothetical protein